MIRQLDSPEVQKVYERTIRTVIFSQMLGGAGLAAGITVGSLIAAQMLGTEKYAGVPSALFTLGSALAALLVGRITQQRGRRLGLATGFFLGGFGALLIILATILNNVWLLFFSLVIYGAGTATNLQARYAGTDLALPHKRATAVSMAMVATTFGAVLGPNLVGVMSQVARFLHIPELAGIFILAAVAFFAAGFVLYFFLKPDPYLLARDIAIQAPKTQQGAHQRSLIFLGGFVMVMTQIIMVAIMTMTPLHMQQHHHSVNAIGLVIGFHIASMYLPSLVTGKLVTKIGTHTMALIAGFVLVLAAVTTMFAPTDSVPLLILGLSLLGIGWNFGLISGTTAVVDGTNTLERPKIQSRLDVCIAVFGSLAGILSGVVVSFSDYAMLSFIGILLAFFVIIVVAVIRKK